MATTQDCIHYWDGGAEIGRWVTMPVPTALVDGVLADYRRKGYVAVRGLLSIGAPEAAPTADDWAAVAQ